MNDTLTIHSFGLNDRSGKIRWLAYELGLPIAEISVEMGTHRQFPYRDLNPYAAIPTVQWRDETLIESSAICTYVAEHFPDKALIVSPGETDRARYLQWLSVCSNTLETKLVEYFLAGVGLQPAEIRPLTERSLAFKLRVAIEQMPETGFLAGDRFTLADIALAYCLRLAINSKLIEFEQVAGYLTPLMARQAAKDSGFFKSMVVNK